MPVLPKILLKTIWQSLCYRRGSVLITILAVGVSVFTLLSTEHIGHTAKRSFNSTVSGVDLIVGPRTSDVNLLLTTVFRIGQPSQNISWGSYQRMLSHDDVAWAIPISLGDSHREFRVVGTETQFFEHFRYGQSRALEFTEGERFSDLYDVVLGARVAERFNYQLGQKLILSHGLSNTSFQKHDAYPFAVSGVLKATGTPVDNALYVSLAGLEAIHQPPSAKAGQKIRTPTSVSAVMLGLKTRLATFKIQREVNTSTDEPLTAILPGVALTQLWQMSRGVESTLALMTQLILLASILGLGAMMIATLRERSHELAILRALGAGSRTIFILIQAETLLVATLGLILGGAVFLLCVTLADSVVAVKYGIDIGISQLSLVHGVSALYVVCGALAIGAIPALLGILRVRR